MNSFLKYITDSPNSKITVIQKASSLKTQGKTSLSLVNSCPAKQTGKCSHINYSGLMYNLLRIKSKLITIVGIYFSSFFYSIRFSPKT